MTSYGAIDTNNSTNNRSNEVQIPISTSNVDQYLLSRGHGASSSNNEINRRPYIYSLRRNVSRNTFGSSPANSDQPLSPNHYQNENMALRYRLYNRLDPGGTHLAMPDHIIPNEIFSILPFDEFKSEDGKQNSIITIFSIWNTMMGTSLLAMPWVLQQSGLVLGIFLMILICSIASYTAYLVINSPNSLSLPMDAAKAEFSDVCRFFWGKRGEYISVFFSIVVLFGGVIVYFILMSNFLYHSGNVIAEVLQHNSTIMPTNQCFVCGVYCPEEINERNYFQSLLEMSNLWTLQGSVPVILAIFIFPLLNIKSPLFFMKFNILGTFSVAFLVIFTISKLFDCGINLSLAVDSIHYVKLFDWKFPALTGIMALSYFIHNAILTILKNQKNPENNARDLFLGYFLAASCYIVIGTAFFVAFPLRRTCISDNFLNNFGNNDILSVFARLFLLLQMFAVLPLLVYFIRAQFSYIFTGSAYPGFYYVLLSNLGVVMVAVFFAIVYPKIGSLLRYVGSFSGFIYVFTMPCLVHLKKLKLQGRNTKIQSFMHYSIIFLGALNLFLQFFV